MKKYKYLNLLAKKFPNKRAATGEIINLRAILALPKGTEYFLSDLHGEHEAFIHMVKGASGVIRAKVDDIFGDEMTEAECDDLASLIYNPRAEIVRKKNKIENFDQWCLRSIYQLIEMCKSVSTKYTRSKVRKRLPQYWGYSIDELVNSNDAANKSHYYNEIIVSIVESEFKEDFIEELASSISMLAVDKLHIIGDIYDRGAHPEHIMDYLMRYEDVDFQWGNHDIVWMGAATGNWSCITNVLRMNISYNNFDMLESGYGINLRVLSSFAEKYYGDDPCTFFKPKVYDDNKFAPVDVDLAAKMHKAIAVCQFKIEGQTIMEHPEFGMENRLLLDKINLEKGTVIIEGVEHQLRDKNFPTLDPAKPYDLTEDELTVLKTLEASFGMSKDLQEHIKFLYTHGGMYKVINNNLMYHGCIPMNEDGTFADCTVMGKTCSGRAYMDHLDDLSRDAYFNGKDFEGPGHPGDVMWYMWLGSNSPMFGKDKMTTFERLFVDDKATHKEHTVNYYNLIKERSHCERILEEFGLDPQKSHILNGHVPVKIKDGESPVKGGGKLIVIDGGISKAYQGTTGIAGYTFIYNSRYMALAEHKPYSPLREDGEQEFHSPNITTVEVLPKRMSVADTDQGAELKDQIKQLKKLIKAYTKGHIKEIY